MKVIEIYERIRKLGLVSSQVEFSRVWLGRSDRYYSNLIAVRREPSVGTLCGITWRIETIAAHAGDERRKLLMAIKTELSQRIVDRATKKRT